MSLLAAAIVTRSEITIRRAPIEFLEVELAILEEMGLDYDRSDEYPAANGRTRLVDLTVRPSELRAAIDKIHPMPFPGLNIDNLPFFAIIAATATGSTMVHDWVYENRAIYLTELVKLGADINLLDPHRVSSRARPTGRPPRSSARRPCARGRRAAGDARREGHVGPAQRQRHQPRLRAARRAPELDRRPDRDLPRRRPDRLTPASPPSAR